MRSPPLGDQSAIRSWNVDDLTIPFEDAIFGTERCLFASNYPVDSLVASYATILAGFIEAIEIYPQNDQRKLLHDNAARIYRLAGIPEESI